MKNICLITRKENELYYTAMNSGEFHNIFWANLPQQILALSHERKHHFKKI